MGVGVTDMERRGRPDSGPEVRDVWQGGEKPVGRELS